MVTEGVKMGLLKAWMQFLRAMAKVCTEQPHSFVPRPLLTAEEKRLAGLPIPLFQSVNGESSWLAEGSLLHRFVVIAAGGDEREPAKW